MRVGIGTFSLSRRIVGAVAVGLAAILVLFAFVALWTIREATESAYHDRVVIAQTLASRVDDVLRYAVKALEQDAFGFEIGSGSRIPDAQIRRLIDLRTQVGIFASISVVDETGRLLWTTSQEPAEDISSLSDCPPPQAVLRGNGPRVTEFRSTGSPGKIVACISVPVQDAKGNSAGALIAEMDPGNPALGLLPIGEMGSEMYAQLMSADGVILAGTKSFSPNTATEHSALLADLIANHVAGYRVHDDVSEVPYSRHVVAYAPLSMLPSWGVTVEEPSDAVLALPHMMEQRLLLFGTVALLLAAAAAWFGARGAIRPLQQLTGAAERFAAGQLDEPVQLNRGDEIGILARAFDTMRRQLRASLAEVADWNRTALLDPDRVIALVLQKARDLIGADLSGVVIADDDTAELDWRLQDGSSGRCRRLLQDAGDPIIAQVICTGLPLRSTDLEASSAAGEVTSPLLHAEGLRAVLAVPLFAGGQAFGILMVGKRMPTTFGEDQVALLSSLANQGAVALENTRLYQKVQSMAALEERERIAREMHDGLAQVLGFVNTKALAVSRLLEVGKVAEASIQVDELGAMVRDAYVDVRESILGLRTRPRPGTGFYAALRNYLEGFERQSGIPVELRTAGAEEKVRLSFDTELQLLRIVQEALTNVRKHAAACQASVCLTPVDGKLYLVIEDDGQGFDPTGPTRAGWTCFGLKTMRERAESISGTFALESRPGAGTRVVVTVPRDHEEERDIDHACAAG